MFKKIGLAALAAVMLIATAGAAVPQSAMAQAQPAAPTAPAAPAATAPAAAPAPATKAASKAEKYFSYKQYNYMWDELHNKLLEWSDIAGQEQRGALSNQSYQFATHKLEVLNHLLKYMDELTKKHDRYTYWLSTRKTNNNV